MSEPKIVITGTGRCGTTLLVQLLTRLGLDTGFSTDAAIDPLAHAGLETWIGSPDAPRIVKDPMLCERLRPLLEAGAVQVEHVIIPIRDCEKAAASRIRASSYGLRPNAKGGLFKAIWPNRQKEALRRSFYELMDTVAHFDLPCTLLAFPRLAKDWEYTYKKLDFMIPDTSPYQFREVFEACANRDLIHESPLTSSEQALSVVGGQVSAVHKLVSRGYREIKQLKAVNQ